MFTEVLRVWKINVDQLIISNNLPGENIYLYNKYFNHKIDFEKLFLLLFLFKYKEQKIPPFVELDILPQN